MMMTISSLVKYSWWSDTSLSRTRDTVRSHYSWGTQDRFETRPKRMIPKPVLHETEAEIKINYCDTETEITFVVSRPCWFRDLHISGYNTGKTAVGIEIKLCTGRLNKWMNEWKDECLPGTNKDRSVGWQSYIVLNPKHVLILYSYDWTAKPIWPERIHSKAAVETRTVGEERRQRCLEEQTKSHLKVSTHKQHTQHRSTRRTAFHCSCLCQWCSALRCPHILVSCGTVRRVGPGKISK